MVSSEPFERTDGHGFEFLAQQTRFLAEALMLAHAAADSGKRTLLQNAFERAREIRLDQAVYEAANIDVQRAGTNAFGVSAMETAQGLFERLIGGEALVNLVGSVYTFFGRDQYFALAWRFWRSLWFICTRPCAI